MFHETHFCSITGTNRMLADFYVRDMKRAVQKIILAVKCFTEVWTLLKKRRLR